MNSVLLIVGVTLVLLLAVALHEMGHLLGGRLANFRAFLFVAGPIMAERRRDRWALRFNPHLSLWRGASVSAPTDASHLRGRTLLMLAIGPAASLMAGLTCAAIGILTGPPSRSWPSFWLFMFGAASLMVGITTLVPVGSLGINNDGNRILQLLRRSSGWQGELALLALVGISSAGRRPCTWDGRLIEQVLTLSAASPLGILSRRFACAHALDKGHQVTAGRHLEQALAHRSLLRRAAQPGLLAQGAYFFSIHAGDTARARALLGEISYEGLAMPHQISLAEAAVLFAEGKASEAAAALERSRQQLPRATNLGIARADTDLIDKLRKRLVNSQDQRPGLHDVPI